MNDSESWWEVVTFVILWAAVIGVLIVIGITINEVRDEICKYHPEAFEERGFCED